jgi:hypothetical protein
MKSWSRVIRGTELGPGDRVLSPFQVGAAGGGLPVLARGFGPRGSDPGTTSSPPAKAYRFSGEDLPREGPVQGETGAGTQGIRRNDVPGTLRGEREPGPPGDERPEKEAVFQAEISAKSLITGGLSWQNLGARLSDVLGTGVRCPGDISPMSWGYLSDVLGIIVRCAGDKVPMSWGQNSTELVGRQGEFFR